MTVLDTNIVIAYLQDDPSVSAWIERVRHREEDLCISTITVVELLCFPKISEAEIAIIERWLRVISIIDVDESIAREASRIRRVSNLTTTDCIIAATAVLLDGRLATRDKAFKKLKKPLVFVP